MKLSEAEAAFVAAVDTQFAFLVRDRGFVQLTPSWDGQGISVVHHDERLDVSNYLEGGEQYLTWLFPLTSGARLPIVDEDGDELFAYFALSDLTPSSPKGPDRFADTRELEHEVAARAQALRGHIDRLLTDRLAFAQIRERVRLSRLSDLIPRWRSFVDSVKEGFTGSIGEYVAGVNVRGQIGSFLKWNGKVPPALANDLVLADTEFEQLTVPISSGARMARYRPHPRAQRWWRLPEKPEGKLRDYFFSPDRLK